MTEHSLKHFTDDMLAKLERAGKDFTAHSIFSPSGSHMWANCSGSLIPNLFASDGAGFEAAEGTVAHGVAELWLQTGERPDHLVGTKEICDGHEIEITADMLDYLGQYVDWCNMQPGVLYTETKVDFSDLTPIKRQRGTSDHAACQIGKLTITDLKYGVGVQVFAKDNTQAILYAYGFFKEYDELFDFQEIEIRICQPRLNHFDTWTITREELLRWAKWLKKRAYAAWCSNAVRTPGEKQCSFCKIKQDCAAHAVYLERMTDGVFDNLDEPVTADDMNVLMTKLDDGTFDLRPVDTGKLTVEQKLKLLQYAKMIRKWFDEIESDIEARVLRGEEVPGKKAVEGRSNRIFTNMEAATEHLEFLGFAYDDIRPRGMIGITEVEDRLVKEHGYRRKDLPALLAAVVRKPDGKPTVVDASDPRPALVINTDDVFDDLDADEL